MEIIGVIAIILMVAIIVLCWNIFSKGRYLIVKYMEKYQDGVVTDFNNADELRDILKTKCYGVTQIKILTTYSLEVCTNHGKHILYLEDGRLKGEFPDIPLGISRIRTLFFTFTATKKMQQAKELSDILECAKSGEATLVEFEKHQNDTAILKVKKYTKMLYISLVAIVLIFVGLAIFNNTDTVDGDDYITGDEYDLESDYYQIGETISFSQYGVPMYELTFTDYGTGQKYDGSGYTYIEYELENIGSESVYFYESDVKCYADGYSVGVYFGGPNDNNNNYGISPGRKSVGRIDFEVDIEEVDSLQLEYADALWVIK